MPVLLGSLGISRRQVIGPVTRTYYLFEPYATVEDSDAPDILHVMTKIGCDCNGGRAQYIPAFATKEDIMSGKHVPTWAGEFGSPAPVRRGSRR